MIAKLTVVTIFAAVSTVASANPTGPYSYGKGENGLVANPSNVTLTTPAVTGTGASTEQLLIVGKGEQSNMINPKAVQSKQMQQDKSQFVSKPGELGLVMLKSGDRA